MAVILAEADLRISPQTRWLPRLALLRRWIKINLAQPLTVTTNHTTVVLVDFAISDGCVQRGTTIAEKRAARQAGDSGDGQASRTFVGAY